MTVVPADHLPKLLAFLLPQYHPIPENDAWWGKGFTEWTNVARARPAFPGHYQPHLPADLGFYDLRLPEARAAQAELARQYSIHGFCYYHYWFNGRRLLERPFNEVLRSGEPDFPICLCWANENWTRRWDGREQEILLGQRYDVDDYRTHLRWLATAFADRRYIRIGDRPLFLVYSAGHVPDARRMTDIWREEANRLGLGELYLCNVQGLDIMPPSDGGFDAAVEFYPGVRSLGFPFQLSGHKVCHYPSVVYRVLHAQQPDYPRFRCVVPSWDNSARRIRGATILHGSTPDLYQYWLEQVLTSEAASSTPAGPRLPFVFVNAWNEWAEGNHLEPDQRWAHGYLHATRQAIEGVRSGKLLPEPNLEAFKDATEEGGFPVKLIRDALNSASCSAIEEACTGLQQTQEKLGKISYEIAWLDRIERLIGTIDQCVTPGQSISLLDDLQLGLGNIVHGRRLLPFPERNGEYWGAPADDEAAIQELDRLVAAGVRFVAVAWPSAWYLDFYKKWAAQLRVAFPKISGTSDLMVFSRT